MWQQFFCNYDHDWTCTAALAFPITVNPSVTMMGKEERWKGLWHAMLAIKNLAWCLRPNHSDSFDLGNSVSFLQVVHGNVSNLQAFVLVIDSATNLNMFGSLLNLNMKIISVLDALLQHCCCARNEPLWYLSSFKHGFQVSFQNATAQQSRAVCHLWPWCTNCSCFYATKGSGAPLHQHKDLQRFHLSDIRESLAKGHDKSPKKPTALKCLSQKLFG